MKQAEGRDDASLVTEEIEKEQLRQSAMLSRLLFIIEIFRSVFQVSEKRKSVADVDLAQQRAETEETTC